MANDKKEDVFSRVFAFFGKIRRGTSSNVEELEGRLMSLVRELPLCGKTSWKLKEVERLLAQGVPVNSQTSSGYTVLHFACLNDDSRTAELLLCHGFCVNATNSHGSTPLHAAAWSIFPSSALIRILYNNGANINAMDSDGRTPLHCAVMQEDPSCTSTLISLGSDIHICSSRSDTFPSMVNLASDDRPMVYAVRSGRLANILLLLQHGDSFEDFDPEKLFLFCYSREIHYKFVKLFVEAGLKVPVDYFTNRGHLFPSWPKSLKDWLCNPLPLTLLCMKRIRKCFGRDGLEEVSNLNLPFKIKQRIEFDIDSFGLDLECKSSLNGYSKYVSFNLYRKKPCRS